MDILETIVFVGSLFIVLYLFIVQPHQVRGASMDNTFHNGDYILTSKIAYKFGQIKRGDIIVFKSPKNPDIDFIKRVIAISGDTIKISDSNVYINDQILKEPYTTTKTSIFDSGFIADGEVATVPPGYVFVMGDNRPRSSDSREFGFIPKTDIIGEVFFRYYPPNKIGQIKNPFTTQLTPFPGINLSLENFFQYSRRFFFISVNG